MAIKETNEKDFLNDVIGSDAPVLVDFWAPWCGPCKMLTPIIEQIASEETRFNVVTVNADENPKILQQYGVRGLPTLMFFSDGIVLSSRSGAQSKSQIMNWVDFQLNRSEPDTNPDTV